MPTIQRLLTDETGQSLVTAINNIVAAVKPNATEIQMGANDTTTVAEAINTQNQALSNLDAPTRITDNSSLSVVETNIKNAVNSMGTKSVRVIVLAVTAYFGLFKGGDWITTIYRTSNDYFSGIATSYNNATGIIYFQYINGTWTWNQLAVNSDIFISGTIGSRLALLDATGDSYTIPATGMYKLSFSGTGGQVKMNGSVLFDNNIAVQFVAPFKQGASLSWTKAGGTCGIYRVE